MTFDQIRTFLTVIECGSISTASNVLFASQSTISSRIKLLEEELAVQLLIRNKGVRNIELTPHGKAFIPIAQQWLSLWQDTKRITEQGKIQTLNIGSVDLINNFTFFPLYQRYLSQYPNTKLCVNTFHSPEIHSLIENRIIDIGFVFSQVKYQNIISKPVYREKMYLICHQESDYYDNIHPTDLDIENEIYLRWGADFEQWHHAHWDPHRHPVITVNTGSLIARYLDKPGYWAIAPMSLVSHIKEFYHIACYQIQEPPPPRICYLLTHRYAKPSLMETIKIFEQEVTDFVSSNANICRFESWMLEK